MCCIFSVKAIFIHDEAEGLRRNPLCFLLNVTYELRREISAFSLAVFSNLDVA
jgi:hypothetical protein